MLSSLTLVKYPARLALMAATDTAIEEAAAFHDETTQKNRTNHDLVDREVAKYATDNAIEVDEATSKRLKRMIDKRVLVVMMVTYLIQTIDKGALSFASVMGIIEDTNLQGNQVCYTSLSKSFR